MGRRTTQLQSFVMVLLTVGFPLSASAAFLGLPDCFSRCGGNEGPRPNLHSVASPIDAEGERPQSADEKQAMLAMRAADEGDFSLAVDLYTRAIEINANIPVYYNNRAAALTNIGQLSRAIEDYDTAIQLDPTVAVIYHNRASVLEDIGNYELALEGYDEAIRREPTAAVFYDMRGSLRLKTQDVEGALSDFRAAIKLDAGVATYRFHRAKAFVESGDEPAAIKDLREAIRLDGSLAGAKKLIANLEERASGLKMSNEPSEAIGSEATLKVDQDMLLAFRAGEKIRINGRVLEVKSVDAEAGNVIFLGGSGIIPQGVNYLETFGPAGQFKFWRDESALQQFKEPYEESYAILVAIDEYERKGDIEYPGPTGYHSLTGMVPAAMKLGDVLTRQGFPRENILTLFNKDATTRNINALLAEFWEGGEHQDADRLFFYFGGHGGGSGGNGYLVTYDFNPTKPTSSGFFVSDFAGRQFSGITARQVLVALDSCSSGLAIPGAKTLSGPADRRRLASFATLSVIRENTEQRARNMLVAGTEDQEAVWDTSGIFTQQLIAGIDGEADLFKDGVVQFDELSLFLGNRVTSIALSQYHVAQNPVSFVASQYGAGKVVFVGQSPLWDRK